MTQIKESIENTKLEIKHYEEQLRKADELELSSAAREEIARQLGLLRERASILKNAEKNS